MFDNVSWTAVSAGLSAVAAIAAALATWRAPRSAVHLAERLRRASEAETALRQAKQNVFVTLLSGRARIDAPDVVAALDQIDFVFSASRPVRNSWAELVSALGRAAEVETRPALRRLLGAMADDLGVASDIGSSDLDRVYYPRSMQAKRLAEQISDDRIIAESLGRGSPVADAASPEIPFPPPPN